MVDAAAIADWLHGNTDADLAPVRAWAARADLWQPRHCLLGHDELASGIRMAGGIDCEHALEATVPVSGVIKLDDGVHRYAVAVELELATVPVRVSAEVESPMAWP